MSWTSRARNFFGLLLRKQKMEDQLDACYT